MGTESIVKGSLRIPTTQGDYLLATGVSGVWITTREAKTGAMPYFPPAYSIRGMPSPSPSATKKSLSPVSSYSLCWMPLELTPGA